MDPNLTEDNFSEKLERIIERIEDEKCILILGPDIALEGKKSLNEQIKEFLDKKSLKKYRYYIDDEFYSFVDDLEKEDAVDDIKEFFDKLGYGEIHKKIAEIPFHLIISVSPDLRIRKAFKDKGLEYTFDFYNKEQNPQEIGKPTKSKPLIYNLFGNIEKEGSLIFTYNDLFDYLIAIFGKRELHMNLRMELQEAKMILFIGFKFEKWYFKLLLRLLYDNKVKRSHAAVKDIRNYFIEEGKESDNYQAELFNCVKNFYTEEYKIGFIDLTGEQIIEEIHKELSRKNELRTTHKIQAESTAEIYLSYGWGGENEAIVDKIYESFKEKGYNIIRDRMDLGYKGNIKEFMQSIGKGKYVISIISDKYLKSENCMYEMLEIKNKGDINDRIFPVVLRDARIYNDLERIEYIKFWEEKKEELLEKSNMIKDPVQKLSVYEKIKEYTYINLIIDDVTNMLKNMNTLTPEMHLDSDFKYLFDAIDKKMKEDFAV
jgi:hypothetical protein